MLILFDAKRALNIEAFYQRSSHQDAYTKPVQWV